MPRELGKSDVLRIALRKSIAYLATRIRALRSVSNKNKTEKSFLNLFSTHLRCCEQKNIQQVARKIQLILKKQ